MFKFKPICNQDVPIDSQLFGADGMKKLKELNVKNIIYSNSYGGYTLCKTIHYNTNKPTIGRYLIRKGMEK